MNELIDLVSRFIAFATLIVGVVWGLLKFFRRDEHFPRVEFEVDARFVGQQGGRVLVEVVAVLTNRGLVPVRIRDMGFKLRGLRAADPLQEGDPAIRGQLRIPHLLKEGEFVPGHWGHTFIYPGVRTEYNYITALDADVRFLRVEGSFAYDRPGHAHHAARLLKVAAA